MLERVHGKGTYITGPQVDSRLHLTSFSREMRARGLVPATVVLAASEQPADDDVAYALRVRPGRPVIRVERLRMADGTPMAYEVGHYPSTLFPGLLQRELGSLYDVFANEYGVVVTSGEQTVRAESADAHQARTLGIAKRAPLLVQERVTHAGDRVIELSTSWYRADRYRIHMAITPRGAQAEVAEYPRAGSCGVAVVGQDGWVSLTPIVELVVPYDAGPLTEKVARRRALVRSRIISLVITVVVLVAIYFWQRDQLQGNGFLVVYAVVVGIPVVWLVVVLIMYVRARKRCGPCGRGIADPGRVRRASRSPGLGASWPEVAAVAAVKPGVGKGPVLRLTLHDGRQAAVPFEQITVFPATLDGAVRAFSASRHGVDLSALDN